MEAGSMDADGTTTAMSNEDMDTTSLEICKSSIKAAIDALVAHEGMGSLSRDSFDRWSKLDHELFRYKECKKKLGDRIFTSVVEQVWGDLVLNVIQLANEKHRSNLSRKCVAVVVRVCEFMASEAEDSETGVVEILGDMTSKLCDLSQVLAKNSDDTGSFDVLSCLAAILPGILKSGAVDAIEKALDSGIIPAARCILSRSMSSLSPLSSEAYSSSDILRDPTSNPVSYHKVQDRIIVLSRILRKLTMRVSLLGQDKGDLGFVKLCLRKSEKLEKDSELFASMACAILAVGYPAAPEQPVDSAVLDGILRCLTTVTLRCSSRDQSSAFLIMTLKTNEAMVGKVCEQACTPEGSNAIGQIVERLLLREKVNTLTNVTLFTASIAAGLPAGCDCSRLFTNTNYMTALQAALTFVAASQSESDRAIAKFISGCVEDFVCVLAKAHVDEAAANALVSLLLDLYLGKRKASLSTQRCKVMECLERLSQFESQDHFPLMQRAVLDGLGSWLADIKNESSEDARCAGYRCLLSWALKSNDETGGSVGIRLPEKFRELFVSRFSVEKEQELVLQSMCLDCQTMSSEKRAAYRTFCDWLTPQLTSGLPFEMKRISGANALRYGSACYLILAGARNDAATGPARFERLSAQPSLTTFFSTDSVLEFLRILFHSDRFNNLDTVSVANYSKSFILFIEALMDLFNTQSQATAVKDSTNTIRKEVGEGQSKLEKDEQDQSAPAFAEAPVSEQSNQYSIVQWLHLDDFYHPIMNLLCFKLFAMSSDSDHWISHRALSGIRIIARLGSRAASELLFVLWNILNNEQSRAVVSTDSPFSHETGDQHMAIEGRGGHLRRVFYSILSCNVSEQMVPVIFLCAHHDIFCHPRDHRVTFVQSRLWTQCHRRIHIVVDAPLPAEASEIESATKSGSTLSTSSVSFPNWFVPPFRSIYIRSWIHLFYGQDGLHSTRVKTKSCAVRAIVGLVRVDKREVLSVMIGLVRATLHYVGQHAQAFSEQDFIAYQSMASDSGEATSNVDSSDRSYASAASSDTGAGRKKKLPGGSEMSARDKQQMRAELDRKKALEQTKKEQQQQEEATGVKVEALKVLFLRGSVAAYSVEVLSKMAPREMHEWLPVLIPLTLNSCALKPLTRVLLRSLNALCQCCFEVEKVALDQSWVYHAIGYALFCLYDDPLTESDLLWWRSRASSALGILVDIEQLLRSPFRAETFVLLLPLLGAVVSGKRIAMSISSSFSQPTTRTNSSSLKEDLGFNVSPDILNAGLKLLLSHIKSGVECASEAAGLQSGRWLLAVLERQDALFSTASEALYELSSAALTPGVKLKQVLRGLLSGKESVREACLEAVSGLDLFSEQNPEYDEDLVRHLWLACHDVDQSIADRANELWQAYGQSIEVERDVSWLLGLVTHEYSDVRHAAAKAMAELIAELEDNAATATLMSSTLSKLFTMYTESLSERIERPRTIKNPTLPSLPAKDIGLKGKAPLKVSSLAPKGVREAAQDSDPKWHAREGVAASLLAFANAGALRVNTDLPVLFAFLCARGLGDSNDQVRSQMASASVKAIDQAGPAGPTVLMSMVESQLSKPIGKGDDDATIAHADRTRENLIVCLGTLASHLSREDPRVGTSILKVIQTAIETPSENVQRAAMRCLTPLASAIQLQSSLKSRNITDELYKQVMDTDKSYGERRGAAYALAGIARGLSLRGLKQLGILQQVYEAAESKSAKVRQGALMSFEILAFAFGTLFEPYTVRLVSVLLEGMGDSSQDVRVASQRAAEAMMAELTSEGVRLVLPNLLSGLNSMQWRTKAAAAELLGSMAFCAPRQLALCLPQIVPKLADAMANAHPKVTEASEAAVARIAAVARNPEVRQLSNVLISALRDPTNGTRGALDAMLSTEFIHTIDAASLSLLVPPLQRALRQRETESKKRAALIVGSMSAHVANASDVVPYLDQLLPELQSAVFDPNPDVRKTAARACGSLANSLRTSVPGRIRELDEWLKKALADPTKSTAERSGAALSLAEISVSMTGEELDMLIESEILSRTEMSQAVGGKAKLVAMNEGALQLVAALPFTIRDRLEEKDRVPKCLPLVLRGLASDSDLVRDAAMLAGKAVVRVYAKTSLKSILPVVLNGIQDKNWRIRFSSVQLLGDFVMSIAGAGTNVTHVPTIDSIRDDDDENLSPEGEKKEHGKREDELNIADDEEDESSAVDIGISAQVASEAMTQVLGPEKKNEVLAVLYIARCDVSNRVRQSAVQVWKMVVHNTPRVLREVLPLAIQIIIRSLGDADEERRATAGRTLGDLTAKLGERVMPEVLPVLRKALVSNEERVRCGACEGLDELVVAAPPDQLSLYSNLLIDTVQLALCDSTPAVRESGATIFLSLYKILGIIVLESVIPHLVIKIATKSPSVSSTVPADGSVEPGVSVPTMSSVSLYALDGLKNVLSICGPRVLSFVVPRIIAERPLSCASIRALSAASFVGGANMADHVSGIVTALLASLTTDVIYAEVKSCIEELMKQMCTSDHDLISGMYQRTLDGILSADPVQRTASAQVTSCICIGAPSIAEEHAGRILEVFVRQCADTDLRCATACWNVVNALLTSVGGKEVSSHTSMIRHALRLAAADAKLHSEGEKPNILGLNTKNGPSPFVSIFIEALLHGSLELREQGALALAEIIDLCDSIFISPFVVKIAGALIRVASERFPWQLKGAILLTIWRLLEACPTMMKTFVPQLQSTFLKSLMDESRLVRSRAAHCIGSLANLQPRLDVVVMELVSLGTGKGECLPETRESAWDAIRFLLREAKSLAEPLLSLIIEKVFLSFGDSSLDVRCAAAKAFGELIHRAEFADAGYKACADSIGQGLMTLSDRDVDHAHGKAYALGIVFKAWTESHGNDGTFGKSSEAKPAVKLRPIHALSQAEINRLVQDIQPLASNRSPIVRSAAYFASAQGYICSSNPGCIQALRVGIESDTSMDSRLSAIKNVALACMPFEISDSSIRSLLPGLLTCLKMRNTAIVAVADRSLRKMLLDYYGNDKAGVDDLIYELFSDDDASFIRDHITTALRATEVESEEEEEHAAN